MWKISVRMGRRPGWLSIWSGAGRGVERDAYAQFSRMCRRIDGHRSEPENRYAAAWMAVRLEPPHGDVIEYPPRDVVSTLPPPA